MLVLTRKVGGNAVEGEEVTILKIPPSDVEQTIAVYLLKVRSAVSAQLGFEAHKGVRIIRKDLMLREGANPVDNG